MKDVLPIFAKRLQNLVKEQFPTLKEFALKIGIPYTTVNGWTLGKKCPSINYLNQVADFFNTSTDYLLGRKDFE